MRALPETPLERVRSHLVGLKMSRALEVLDDCARRVEDGQLSAMELVDALLGEEHATRETRRIKSSLMTARLRSRRSKPSLEKNRVLALAELASSSAAKWCIGPPGTGKSQSPWGSRR